MLGERLEHGVAEVDRVHLYASITVISLVNVDYQDIIGNCRDIIYVERGRGGGGGRGEHV